MRHVSPDDIFFISIYFLILCGVGSYLIGVDEHIWVCFEAVRVGSSDSNPVELLVFQAHSLYHVELPENLLMSHVFGRLMLNTVLSVHYRAPAWRLYLFKG